MGKRIFSKVSLSVVMGTISAVSVLSSCSDSVSEKVFSQESSKGSVKFILLGIGSVPTQSLSVKIDKKGKVTFPQEEDFETTKSCYVFDGEWYKESACETPWDASMDSITEETILYGKWAIKKRIKVHGHEGCFMGTFNENNDPVYWATTNIGADSAYKYGDYYAWGDTLKYYSKIYFIYTGNNTPYNYTDIIWEESANDRNVFDHTMGFNCYNYKWTNSGEGDSVYKYIVENINGIQTYNFDGLTELEKVDDIAHHIWGNGWQMPSVKDFNNMWAKCVFVWDTLNGVAGITVYKAKDKRDETFFIEADAEKKVPSGQTYSDVDIHIFFPSAGNFTGGDLDDAGYDGGYWSSSLYLTDPCRAYGFHFNEEEINSMFFAPRHVGASIRAVFDIK